MSSCCQPVLGLSPEQVAVRPVASAALVFGILGCILFLSGNLLAGLGGIIAIIAGSLIVCCGPTDRRDGAVRYLISALLASAVFSFNFVAAVLAIVYALVRLESDGLREAVYLLVVFTVMLLACAVDAIFVHKSLRARRAVMAAQAAPPSAPRRLFPTTLEALSAEVALSGISVQRPAEQATPVIPMYTADLGDVQGDGQGQGHAANQSGREGAEPEPLTIVEGYPPKAVAIALPVYA